MTDREQIIAMLRRAKIEYEEIGPCVIQVERGYSGFVTVFMFDANGNLTDMGAYE